MYFILFLALFAVLGLAYKSYAYPTSHANNRRTEVDDNLKNRIVVMDDFTRSLQRELEGNHEIVVVDDFAEKLNERLEAEIETYQHKPHPRINREKKRAFEKQVAKRRTRNRMARKSRKQNRNI